MPTSWKVVLKNDEELRSLLRGINFTDLQELDTRDINSMIRLRIKYLNSINVLDKQLADMNTALNNITVANRVVSFISDSQPFFTDILIDHLHAAWKINFDYKEVPGWYNHIINLLTGKESSGGLRGMNIGGGFVTVTPTIPQTDSSIVSPTITWKVEIYKNMMKYLGGPDDYGNAVKAARAALNYGNKTGSNAWIPWYYNVWKPAIKGVAGGRNAIKTIIKNKFNAQMKEFDEGKRKRRPKIENIKLSPDQLTSATKATKKGEFYGRIMKTRLLYMEGMAPYWFLLEHGAVHLSSDKGSRGIPLMKTTHFVEQAEKRVMEFCQQRFPSYRSAQEVNLKNDIERLTKLLVDSREILRILDAFIGAIRSFSVSSFQVALERVTVAMSTVLVETHKYPELWKVVNSRIQLLARQISIGVAPARVELLYTRDRTFRMRIAELQSEVLSSMSGKGVPPPLLSDITEIQKEIELLKEKVAIQSLWNKQVKQLRALNYSENFIKAASQQEISNIIMYKIQANKVYGPQVKVKPWTTTGTYTSYNMKTRRPPPRR